MIRKEGQLTFETHGEALVARLRGEIDHHGAVGLRTEIDSKLAAQKPERFFLDLSAVDFMDSSGLGLIMGRFALVRRYGGKMALLDPAPAVIKILNLAGMEKMIPIRISQKSKERVGKEA